MASRAWCHPGVDLRVVLEHGDNGVSYTVDGIHPNHAGYMAYGAAWLTVFGL